MERVFESGLLLKLVGQRLGVFSRTIFFELIIIFKSVSANAVSILFGLCGCVLGAVGLGVYNKYKNNQCRDCTRFGLLTIGTTVGVVLLVLLTSGLVWPAFTVVRY